MSWLWRLLDGPLFAAVVIGFLAFSIVMGYIHFLMEDIRNHMLQTLCKTDKLSPKEREDLISSFTIPAHDRYKKVALITGVAVAVVYFFLYGLSRQ